MDREDANGIALEWMTFLAKTIAGGTVDIGGEIITDLTSSAGHDYHVEITSAPGEDGAIAITGRVTAIGTGTETETGTEGDEVLETHAEFTRPVPDE